MGHTGDTRDTSGARVGGAWDAWGTLGTHVGCGALVAHRGCGDTQRTFMGYIWGMCVMREHAGDALDVSGVHVGGQWGHTGCRDTQAGHMVLGGTCGDIHGTCIGHIRGTRGMWRARRRHTGDTRGTQRGYVGDTGHLQDTENAHTGHWNMRGSSRGEGAGGTEDTTRHRHAGDRQSHETRRGPARGHLGDRTLEPWHTQGTDRGHSRDTKDPGREK